MTADMFTGQYATEYLGKVFYFCLKKTAEPEKSTLSMWLQLP